MSKAIVFIEEMDSVADVTFPAVPVVISLLMYDDTARARDSPRPSTGYPVVCVTVSGHIHTLAHTHTHEHTHTHKHTHTHTHIISIQVSIQSAILSTTNIHLRA